MAHDEGKDTALARLLLARGVVDVATLRACLEQVRRERALDPGASLAGSLLARGVPRAALEQADTMLDDAGPPPVAAAAAPAFGEHRVVRELARGGMGVLYEVEHLPTAARRALKTMSIAGLGAEELLRFRREAELLARLDHPAIVCIHAARLDGPAPYLVQDLLPGGSLEERLARGPLAFEEARALAATLARGLEHAHARGVLHRDLKPSNVVFDDRGRPRLVDLGLARPLDASSLTVSGTILGTPAYMAPEQARGERADERTDVYGLGAVLYAMLTGRAPHAGPTTLAVLVSVLEGPPPSPSRLRADVPPALEAVCARALARDPAARFSGAKALAEALEAADAAAPGPERRAARAPLLLGAALLVAIVVAVALLTPPSRGGDLAPGTETAAHDAPGRPPAGATATVASTTSLEVVLARAAPGEVSRALEAALRDLPGRLDEADAEALRALATVLDDPLLRPEALDADATRAAMRLVELEPFRADLGEDASLPDREEALERCRASLDAASALRPDAAVRRALRGRAQRLLGQVLARIGLLSVEDVREDLARWAESHVVPLGPEVDLSHLLIATERYRADAPRARELLAGVRGDLPARYVALADALRLAVRAPGITPARGEELLAADGIHDMHGVGRRLRMDGGRELGRLYRLEAFRLRREGGAEEEVQAALSGARRWGERAAGDSTDARQELVLTLLASRDFDAAGPMIARLEARDEEAGAVRALLESELALVLGDPGGALTRLERHAERGVAVDLAELWVVRAHARARLGQQGWRRDLERARACEWTLGIEWRQLDVALDVIEGRCWWPGAP